MILLELKASPSRPKKMDPTARAFPYLLIEGLGTTVEATA